MSAIATVSLGKRYRNHWALRDCTLSVPAGRVVGLVGTNGAGKSTFLHLAAGLLDATEGTVTVAGEPQRGTAAQLARIGFLAQDAPTYRSLTVNEHLHLGSRMNASFDSGFARDRVTRLGLDPRQRAGGLSGGQRSQLALTLAMGKRPELLLLDEPVASLDPLARREFLQDLMELVAERQPTVVLSSHLLADVDRVCDHLIVLVKGQVRLAGDVDVLLAQHRNLIGPRRDLATLPASQKVIRMSHTERQTTAVIRTSEPVLDPRWVVTEIGLEDLVLAYMSTDAAAEPGPASLEAVPS
jgi:ABC-2 type transport system ATP-binding protein